MQRIVSWPVWAAIGLISAGLFASTALASGATLPEVDKSQGNLAIIYPAKAQNRGEVGKVSLLLEIDAKGKPTGRVQITKSSGYDDLDTAAVQSVMTWRYVPAHAADGTPKEGWAPLQVVYKLPKAKPASE